jgi:hypothetical protein
MRRGLCLTVPAVALAVLAGLAAADPVAADPYAITPDAGPWVICAASYMGEDASNLAHQLAEQLRTRHGLPAYVFDRGDEEKRRDRAEHAKKEAFYGVQLPFRHPRYMSQFAVLIGGYPDMDAAKAAMVGVKKLPPPDLKLSNGKQAFDTELVKKPDEQMQQTAVNPLSRSFVTRNPAAPAAKSEGAKIDPIWKELNASESYSLLKNPKTWTLVVKDYSGATAIQQRSETAGLTDFLGRMGLKVAPGEQLNAAGKQAHGLAEFLRDRRIGLDAYVLHTRTNSIVTVGAFDSLDDPELQRTKQRLEAMTFKADTRNPNASAIKGDPIGLFAHPLPMEVPHF